MLSETEVSGMTLFDVGDKTLDIVLLDIGDEDLDIALLDICGRS